MHLLCGMFLVCDDETTPHMHKFLPQNGITTNGKIKKNNKNASRINARINEKAKREMQRTKGDKRDRVKIGQNQINKRRCIRNRKRNRKNLQMYNARTSRRKRTHSKINQNQVRFLLLSHKEYDRKRQRERIPNLRTLAQQQLNVFFCIFWNKTRRNRKQKIEVNFKVIRIEIFLAKRTKKQGMKVKRETAINNRIRRKERMNPFEYIMYRLHVQLSSVKSTENSRNMV